jgi:peptide methionine sulfoxide reductase MsrA
MHFSTSPNPTYAHIGDHTEIVELIYDSTVTSFAQILDHFWSHHDATVDHRKQYASAIIYVDDEQRQLAQLSKDNRQLITSPRKIATYIQALEHFYQVLTTKAFRIFDHNMHHNYRPKTIIRNIGCVHNQLSIIR